MGLVIGGSPWLDVRMISCAVVKDQNKVGFPPNAPLTLFFVISVLP